MSQWLTFLSRFFRFPVRLITQPRLLIYFLLVIVLFGGLGTWISFGQWRADKARFDLLNVYHNFATYIIAIAVTAFADYLMTKRENENRTLTLALFGLALISALAAVVVLVVDTMDTVKTCATMGAASAALLWLIINDENENLTEGNPLSAIGGTVR